MYTHRQEDTIGGQVARMRIRKFVWVNLKMTLPRPKCRWHDNIKTYCIEISWEDLGGINVGHYQQLKTKLRGLSPRANYTDRAAAAGRRN